ncbi:MAG TPA: HU family DNA-binding protein [Desulfobulbus sp.]|nr:HU family DNA-binding protein [Desulfobulbus sp.]
MNKTELIHAITQSTDLNQTVAAQAVQGFLETVTGSLSRGEKISLSGFGTFAVVNRAARCCRNPQNGKKMTIAPCKAVKFRPGKKLMESVG